MSAEYIMAGGNEQVVLCERGIRTFDDYTRNTLDLAAVPMLKELSHLPIIVDPSHATGIARLVKPMALAGAVCGADGLIVTGPATGCPTALSDLNEVRAAVPHMPLLVGSGVTPEQIPALAHACDGLIVGTWIKEGGDWRNPVSRDRVSTLREALDRAANAT